MASIRESVLQYLTGLGWEFEEHDSFVAAPVTAEHGDWTVLFYLPDDEPDQLIIHSLLPVDVPAAEFGNVAAFLTLANFGIAIGNFEMDTQDGPNAGEVRYKTSIDVAGSELTQPLLSNLFDANIVAADTYLPGLEQAAAGRPATACIAEIEA